MSRLNLEDSELRRPTIVNKLRYGTISKTLTADLTLDADSPPLITLDPGGATRKVIMPSETVEANKGLTFYIRNGADAAEDLTIRNSTDTTTMGTISQNEAGTVVLMPAIAGGTTYTWVVGVDTTT